MSTLTKELTKAERRVSDFSYITEVMQRGRIKPAKYIHSLYLTVDLYEELKNKGLIQIEFYLLNEIAFFEFKRNCVIISFVCLRSCDDLNRIALTYLVVKELGYCPIVWKGVSKMNFDKEIELLQIDKTCKKKYK